jgi:hypothetical protein
MEEQTEGGPRGCAHHWVIEGGRAVKLPRDTLMRHPNCIGRAGLCKKCGAEGLHLEKVWDQIWRD